MKATRRIPWTVQFLMALVLTGTVSFSGYGQNITSQLTGIVTDQTGAVIPDAKIMLKNDLSGDVSRTVSNSEGYFTFAAISAGNYTVTIEAAGVCQVGKKGSGARLRRSKDFNRHRPRRRGSERVSGDCGHTRSVRSG